MKILELFCGTKSISKAFAANGHEVYTVDWEKDFQPSLCADVGALAAERFQERNAEDKRGKGQEQDSRRFV